MRERVLVIVAAAALLVAVTLPGLFSAPIIPGASASEQQASFEQVARATFYAQC